MAAPSPTNLETISFHKWKNSLQLTNGHVEAVITTDVGPRVILFKHHQHDNVFQVLDAELGGMGESEWKIRGGHRFWVAPEDPKITYHADNSPVTSRQDLATGEVLIESTQTSPSRIKKTLGIRLAEGAPRATLRHILSNEDTSPLKIAPWALSVMQPGGLCIIPQPILTEHPAKYKKPHQFDAAELLPNRGMVLWPYTDLSDPRWNFGQKYWLVRQDAHFPATKIGLAHRQQWVAYVMTDCLFIKTFEFDALHTYPDGGCNFELYMDSEILEIESLGPLTSLNPGQSITHVEDWYVFPLTEEVRIESEELLTKWITGFLAQTHIG